MSEKLSKQLILIYGSQTNQTSKKLMNENVSGGLSTCGPSVLDFLDFESGLLYQILKVV